MVLCVAIPLFQAFIPIAYVNPLLQRPLLNMGGLVSTDGKEGWILYNEAFGEIIVQQ